MIRALHQYARDEVVPRWWRVLRQPQVLLAVLLAVATYRFGVRLPLAAVHIGDFTSMLLTYAEIAVGFCIAGLTLVITLPSETLVSLLMKHKLSGQRQSSYADLLFVFSWTALVHWIAIVLCIIGVCVRRADAGLLLPSDKWVWKSYLSMTVAVGAYSLIQFLLTVITLSQVGCLYIREYPRRP